MDLGFAPDSKIAVGFPAQRLLHHPTCPQSLPKPGTSCSLDAPKILGPCCDVRFDVVLAVAGCRSWAVTKKAACSKSNRRRQLHCQASEEDESDTDADGSAARSFWDVFRAEQPKEHLLPEQSKLIGKEVYLLVRQQVITVTIRHSMHVHARSCICGPQALWCT